MGGDSGRVNVSSTTSILVCSPIFNTTKFDYRLWVWCLVPQPSLSNASTTPTPILFSCKVTKRLFERACNFELPGVSVGFYICFLETTFSHSDGTDSVPESVCNGGPEEIREGHIFLRYIIYFWLQIWKLGSFSKSTKAPLSIRLSPNVGTSLQNKGPRTRWRQILALHFGNVPLLGLYPSQCMRQRLSST